MDRGIVHRRFVARPKRGSFVEPLADVGRAVRNQAAPEGIAPAAPPGVIARQRLIGEFEQRARTRPQVHQPDEKRSDRRLVAVDPGVVGGEEAGEIAVRRCARQRDREVFPADLGIENVAQHGRILLVVEPELHSR